MSENKTSKGITSTLFVVGLIATMIIAAVLSTGATLQMIPQGRKGIKVTRVHRDHKDYKG